MLSWLGIAGTVVKNSKLIQYGLIVAVVVGLFIYGVNYVDGKIEQYADLKATLVETQTNLNKVVEINKAKDETIQILRSSQQIVQKTIREVSERNQELDDKLNETLNDLKNFEGNDVASDVIQEALRRIR